MYVHYGALNDVARAFRNISRILSIEGIISQFKNYNVMSDKRARQTIAFGKKPLDLFPEQSLREQAVFPKRFST